MKFGTSGLRGLASDLIGPESSVYAEAFMLHLLELRLIASGERVFIGRDLRKSSPVIVERCAAGLTRHGMVPIDCGALPTPALAAHAMGQGAPCLMVTGSHIPENRNGIKFYRPDGEIGKQDEAAIRSITETLVPGPATPEGKPPFDSDKGEAAKAFVSRCNGILTRGSLTGLRIGVYEHSSVGRDMLHDVLTSFGAQTVALGRSDHFIAVDTEAVSDETRTLLASWAVEHGLDAIVSTDGDADRPLVADETGAPLRGDLLGLVTAEFVGAQTVATPVTSNSGIRSSNEMDVIRTKVGSPYVIEAMNAASGGVVAGFEANGGFLLNNNADVPGGTLSALPTRDCFLPIIATLHATTGAGLPLSKLADSREFPVAVADRLRDFPTEAGSALVADLTGDPQLASDYFAAQGDVTGLDTTDGARFSLNGGEIIHYRPSGNAPELRCYCEAATEERAQQLLEFGLSKAVNRV